MCFRLSASILFEVEAEKAVDPLFRKDRIVKGTHYILDIVGSNYIAVQLESKGIEKEHMGIVAFHTQVT